MMRMKVPIGLTALAFAALVGGSQWVTALQRPQGPGFGPGRPGLPRLQQLCRQLDLTDAQKTQIQGILDSARTQLQTLRNDTATTREQKMDQAQQITQQTRDQIRSALTPEQQLRADELRNEAEQRFAARQAQMEGQILRRLTNRLDLSESQQSAVQLHLQDQKTQLAALKDNTSLTASQKFGQMQFIRQQTQDKIKSVLNAEQQAQLEQLRERFQSRRGDRPRRGRGGPGIGNQGLDL